MREHVVKMGVLSMLAATVMAQSASAHVLATSVPASQGSPVTAATVATLAPPDVARLVEVPERWSFDDAHGAAVTTAAAVSRTAVSARQPASPRTPRTPLKPPKPPTPPAKAVSGALPRAGSPQAVLAAAYVKAAAKAPKGCHLRVAHLAAIGQVESGSVGGRLIDGAHRVSPAIYGPLLDGGPFAVVRDSDRGAYDGASDYDRAVGPLQFLPGTWRWAGRDGDGDGRRDPQNVFDAALATADYLCRDGRDLSHSGDLRAAILTYNWSGEYVAAVTQWVSFFTRHGLASLDDVAFRVGSGGRASSMAVAKPAQDEAAKKAAKKGAKKATKKPKKPTSAAGKPAKRPTSTATPAPLGTATATPAPAPTTTAVPLPGPTAPAPTTPDPSPSSSVPVPTSTTTPPGAPSAAASTPSTG